MGNLGRTGRAWWKAFHIFFSSAWIGAAMSMMIILFLKDNPLNGRELYAYNAVIKIIDDFIIIPVAIGSLCTGLILSWKTNWGFFKHYWIIVKLFVTIAAIVSGALWLGPWTNASASITNTDGLRALHNQQYLYYQQMRAVFGTFQAIAIILMVFISVMRPWGKRK